MAGVPEHFNYPWQIAQEAGLFEKNGVQVRALKHTQTCSHPKVEFTHVKEGTGAMIQMALDGKVDVVVALTEGLVASIVKGAPLRLLGTYVVCCHINIIILTISLTVFSHDLATIGP